MKSFRIIALSVLVTICTFCAVLYSSSCKKDGCKGVTCLNMGTCSGGQCTCPTGYTGTTCQSFAFVGTWKGMDSCFTGTNVITITGSSDSTTLLISSPGNFGTATPVAGVLNSDRTVLTITNQPLGSKMFVSAKYTLTSNTAFSETVSITDTAAVGGYTKSCGSGSYTIQ